MDKIERTRIFDFDFISCGFEDILAPLVNYGEYVDLEDRLPLLITPNVDQLVKLHQKENRQMKDTLSKAAFVLPDGQPIVWSSRLLGKPLRRRLTGSDLFPMLWKELKRTRKRVFIIAPTEEVATLLKQEYEDAETYVPPFFTLSERDEKHKQAEDECLAAIQKFRPEFVFVGLSFPKREILSLELISRLGKDSANVPLFLLIGASLEFYTGVKKRAPELFRKLGLEWFYRFMREPRRLFRRYFIDDLKFSQIFISEFIKTYLK